MLRKKTFAYFFCAVLLITTSGCVTPGDYSFKPLIIGPPISGVPLDEGDYVKIYRKSSAPINLVVTYVSVESEYIYGWLVPDGKRPWMVGKSKRVGEIVDFADIESIQISEVDSEKIAGGVLAEIGKGIYFVSMLFLLAVLFA